MTEVVDGGGKEAEVGGERMVTANVVGVAPRAGRAEAGAVLAAATDVGIIGGRGGWVGREAVAGDDEGGGPDGRREESLDPFKF